MGFYFWQGLMEGTRDEWSLTVKRRPDVTLPPGQALDRQPGFDLAFAWMREWVSTAGSPAFATWSYDDDFAYLCVGVPGQIMGELLFDRDRADAIHDIQLVRAADAGPGGVADWAKSYAPMSTDARVIEAFEAAGGSPDCVFQLFRVFNLELPSPYRSSVPSGSDRRCFPGGATPPRSAGC